LRSSALLAAVVILTIAAYLRWTPPATAGDLRPRPDALEYEAGARNLLRGEGYYVVVEGRAYPPRYPPVFSALLVPFLAVWDEGPGSGILAVFASALLGVALTMLASGHAAGALAGLVAGILLALSPAHVQLSRLVLSDVPSACLAALVAALLVAGGRARAMRPSALAITGLTIGLAAGVRATNALLALPAAFVVALFAGGPRGPATLLAAAGVGAAPVALYNLWTFGSPFRSGYALWVPGMSFSLEYLSRPPAGGGSVPNLEFYAGAVAGFGELYPWPWALLIGLGAVCALRSSDSGERALLVTAALFLTALLATYVLFFWQGARFLIPALPIVFALAGLPLAARRGRAVRATGAALVVAGLVVLARNPSAYRRDAFFGEPAVLRELAAKTERNAVLLLRTNEHFFSLLLRANADRTWVPLGPDDHAFGVRLLGLEAVDPLTPRSAWIDDTFMRPFAADRAATAVRNLLRAGRPVYVSSLLSFQVPFFGRLMDVLGRRFMLERLPMMSRAEVYRVREHAPAPNETGPRDVGREAP
jgi:4-amino-4-deoxy-L-arabinose transferase-like glycosyltransferase